MKLNNNSIKCKSTAVVLWESVFCVHFILLSHIQCTFNESGLSSSLKKWLIETNSNQNVNRGITAKSINTDNTKTE